MIAKTTIGRSFKGCCSYNLQKVEMGQGEILMSQGVRDYDQAAMVADFVRQAKMNPELSRSVWHTAISFAPQDNARLLTNPQLMHQVAKDYLKGMGLEASQYVVVEHRDTDHRHLHIIANRVRSDGNTVGDGHNYSRQTKLMRQIETKYGLTPLIEQQQRHSLENVPERDRNRLAMRDQVRTCLSRSTNSKELQTELARHSIRLIVNKTGEGVARGLSFEQVSQDERGEKVATAFKGSKLHKELSLGHIQQQLALNAELRQKQAIEAERIQKASVVPKQEKAPQITQNHPKNGFGRRM